MLTPRQRTYLDNPKVQMLMKAFDAVPVATQEFRRNEQIRERVEGILSQIAMAPVESRRITRPMSPFENPDLSWVKPGQVPF